MPKKAIIIAVSVVLLVVIVFLALNNNTKNPQKEAENTPAGNSLTSENLSTVVSDDGNASLEIDKSSLPEGVSLGDIKISPKEVKTSDDYKTIAAFDLYPDGLKLSKPAKFSYTYDFSENDAMPEIFHYSNITKEGGTVEKLNAETVVDLDVKKVTVSGDLSHFSFVQIGYSPFAVYLNGISPYYGKKDFTMTAGINAIKNRSYYTYEGEDLSHRISYKNNFTAEGLIRVDEGRDIVTPTETRDAPVRSTYEANDKSFEFKRDFSCSKKGDVLMSYRVDLTSHYVDQWVPSSMMGAVEYDLFGEADKEEENRDVYIVKEKIECPDGLEPKEQDRANLKPFCGDKFLSVGEECIFDYDPPKYTNCLNPEAKTDYKKEAYKVGSSCLLYSDKTKSGICLRNGVCWAGGEKFSNDKARIVVINKKVAKDEPVLAYIYDPGRNKSSMPPVQDIFLKENSIVTQTYIYRSNFCSTTYQCRNNTNDYETKWQGYAYADDPGPIVPVTDFSNWFEDEPTADQKPYWFQTTVKKKFRQPYFAFSKLGEYKLEIIDMFGNRVESEPFKVCDGNACGEL